VWNVGFLNFGIGVLGFGFGFFGCWVLRFAFNVVILLVQGLWFRIWGFEFYRFGFMWCVWVWGFGFGGLSVIAQGQLLRV
jgi:hypothetical protein